MFLEADEARLAQRRRPIVVLDERAEEALAQSGRLLQRSLYRFAREVSGLTDAEAEAARAAGGIFLVAGAFNEHLDPWIDTAGAAGLRATPIVLCDGTSRDGASQELRERLDHLARRTGMVFPVFRGEIEARINCQVAVELLPKAQGFAIAGVVETVENFGRTADGTGADYLAEPEIAAATTVFHRPDVPVAAQARHLLERLFWDRETIDAALRAVVRVQVPHGMSRRTAERWQAALGALLTAPEVRFEVQESGVDDPVCIGLLLCGLPLASRQVMPLRATPAARRPESAAGALKVLRVARNGRSGPRSAHLALAHRT